MDLSDDYYDMALFSYYISEKHLEDQIDFERDVIRNNLILQRLDDQGEIPAEHENRKIYDAQVLEMKIRDLKDKRVLAKSQNVAFKCMTIFFCQMIFVYGAITYYWNANGAAPPMDFRTQIIRFICLFQGHLTYQPTLTTTYKNLWFVITHPYNFTSHASAINIAFAKFIVFLGIELAAYSAAIFQGDGIAILTSFTAFAVISDLAGMYFNSISNDDLKTEMKSVPEGKMVATRNMQRYPKAQVR